MLSELVIVTISGAGGGAPAVNGCGTLASLRENPAWAQLPDEAAALTAIIKRNASRRLDNTPGTGFMAVNAASIASLDLGA